ncbi:MAG: hypothetical protein VYA51_03850 [Planctomycetota bacterium]|nr:hypothetical protein [Planctomycetota bacterium]MEC9047121.1 hypothetical protein [Planctomycetota bacterium]
MAEDWKIHRDRDACDKPGCPLMQSESYFAVLEWGVREAKSKSGKPTGVEVPACIRRDLCAACFEDFRRKCPDDQPPVFWRALRKVAGSKEPVLDLVSLRGLFDSLGKVDDDRARALRYFCALLLLRKRVLKMVRPKTREQEQADLVVRDPKLKEMEPVALFAPAIDASDMTTIKDELLAAIGEGAEDSGEPGSVE